MKREVVVTGIGIWSCIGQNCGEVAESLKIGRSGIGVDESRKTYGYRSPLTGIVPRPDLKPLLNRRLRVGMSEEAEFAYMASREALEMAGVDQAYLDEHEVGVLFGNDSTSGATVQMQEAMQASHDTMMLGSGLIFQSMNSTVNMNMSTIFHLRGINFSISAACASGSHAIGLGKMFIEQGMQDMILVGGAQEVNMYSMAAFDALSAFSVRSDEPWKASRPFDKSRDGLVPSGGAAALILEDKEHALKRGAKILAKVEGYGFSSNGGGISQPSGEGSRIAMQRALDDAGWAADDIDYVNAHATSTQQGDREEAIALAQLFGGKRAMISSTKSMTGHECWMAGASEAVYSILMMQHGFVAPNINLEEPDEACEGLRIARETVDMKVEKVLSNSFGFGGTNSAVCFSKE